MSERRRTAALIVAAGAAVWFATVAFPQTFRSGLVVQGVLAGAASGLLAIGLVLIYRTTRVINLAYQAMGACAAQIGVTAYLHYGWPWPVAVVFALAGGAAAGVLTDLLFRRFEHAPRLVVTVATIGLLQVFTAVQVLVPYLLGANTLVVSFRTGLSDHSFLIGTNPFFGDDVLSLVLVPVALAGLSWFLYRTDAGVAVRGIAENGERALMLGIPSRRLTRLVWVLVGVLAAAVAVLSAPRSGIPANPFVSASGLFLPALAAAVVARFESMSVAFVTAVGLGVLDWVVKDNVSKQALGTVVFLVVILVALAVQRQPRSRAAEDSSWSLGGVTRPLPAAVARLPEIVAVRAVLVGLVAAAAVVLPLVVGPSRTHTYSGYLLLGMVALSLVVLSGWSGTISIGQYAIVGVGAVAAGNLMVKANLDLFASVLLAGVAGAVIGLVLGAPALRIRPLFVLVSSLAFAAAMDQFFLNPVNYSDWIPAQIIRPVLWKRYPLGSERAIYYVCLGLLALTILVVRALEAGRPGRVTLATRDNPRASAAMGLPVTRIRVIAMMVSGAIAGVAGGMTGVLENGVGGSSFPVQASVLVFSMAVVGGLGSVSGVLSGVVVTQALLTLIRTLFPDVAGAVPLATGTLLLFVLIAVPGGIEAGLARVRDRVARRVAARHGVAFEVGAAAGSYDITEPARAPGAMSGGPAPTGGPGPILSCRGLTASYGSLQVLFGVDLDVAEGEMVALLGTNGAGKSTVLKALIGLMSSVEGDVVYDSTSLRGLATDEVARRGIAMMPGGRGVFPSLTVAENLRLACWQRRSDPTQAALARAEAVELFPILANRSDQAAGNLSGGEQQQLSLAMALMSKPRVLFIDELSLGLAPTVVGMLCDKVRHINATGTTVVVVEQSVNVALTLAERAVFLEKGRVRFQGPTRTLLERPDLLRSVFIGETPPATAGGDARDRTGASRGVELTCRGLLKRFGGITAVNEVDLTIPPGRIVGLIGHNGAGKTTLFDVISGFQRPDRGAVCLNGVDVTHTQPHQRVVAGLGRSFQEARLYPALTVRDCIVVALDRHLRNHDTLAAGLALPAALNAEAAAHARADELIDLLGLDGFAHTPVADLSTGTRRIVELACVLALDPAVVLLDEPTAGVAQKDAEALGPLLRRVQAETGSAIAIIEHDMAMLTSLCDEFVALELGAVIATGSPAEVLAHPRVIASYLGTDDIVVHRSGTTRPSHPSSNGSARPGRRRQQPLVATRTSAPNGRSTAAELPAPPA